MQQHVSTSEEELINRTTKLRIKLLPKRGRLFTLFPFYDSDNKGFCVGGRLANSPYNIDKKFSILIPKDSPITLLLIREAHARNLLGGPQLTLFYLRQTIWIPGELSAVKKNYLQLQALHSPRRQDSSAANETSANRTCSFIICFHPHWFGLLPENIYRDNSRIFIGTQGEFEFRKLLMDRDFKELVDAFTTGQQINWLTIPPRTPNFGFLWEAATKSMKRHFYRTVATTKMSLENFTILITQIEVILNFRPLKAPSSDANHPSALTPA